MTAAQQACPECGASDATDPGGWTIAHNDARIIARGVTANEAANGRAALLCAASLTYATAAER